MIFKAQDVPRKLFVVGLKFCDSVGIRWLACSVIAHDSPPD
jgi:hypothetical protein